METAPTDLQDLRAFCLVVDLGSITLAARTLGESKGSVSRRVSRLEEAIGVSLLRRSPRLVQATEDGAAYRVRVGRALELLDDANTEVRHGETDPSGHLRVTAPMDIGLTVVAPRMAGFAERFPSVTVELVLTDALLDFDAHQIDLAFRAGASLRDSALIAHTLKKVEGRLYASPEYLRVHGRPRSVDDLATHRLLIVRANRGIATVNLQRGDDKPLSLRVKSAVSATDFAFLKAVAVSDGGIALLPSLVAESDVAEGRLTMVLKEYQGMAGTLSLVHHGSRILPPKVRAFRDYMLESCGARRRRLGHEQVSKPET